MVMTKRVGKEKVVAGAGVRDVAEYIVIKIIVWEHPLQIIQFSLIKSLPSNPLGPECRMVQEDFQWVGGSRLLLI